MVDFSSADFKPKDWQAFERGCRTLFECIWGDPNAQLNGRGGQRQNGVDIFGNREGGKGALEGMQCKGRHDGKIDGAISATELRAEVEKAKHFKPPLAGFIPATTAPNDAKIQEVARKISEEHKAKGLFEVSVWGWDDLRTRISEYARAIREFHPDATPFTDEILAAQKEGSRLVEAVRQESQLSHAALAAGQAALMAEFTALKASLQVTAGDTFIVCS